MPVMMQTHDDHQKGSALVYILIAIALLGSLTASLLNTSNSQTTSQRTAEVTSALKSQIDMARAAIMECAYTYPTGDNALANNRSLAQRSGFNSPYPLMSDDSYLAAPRASSPTLNDIRCPGNPGNSNNHVKIFGGISGKYMPVPAKPFSSWQYYNIADGVYIVNFVSATDAFVLPVLQKLNSSFSPCEADIIDGRSALKTLDSSGTVCNGYLCFRVWILAKPTATYPDEAGCPAS